MIPSFFKPRRLDREESHRELSDQQIKPSENANRNTGPFGEGAVKITNYEGFCLTSPRFIEPMLLLFQI